MRRPRVSVPITLTTVLVAATVTLTVGWQILVAREFQALAQGFTWVHWLLVAIGSLFFSLIITTALLQMVWLVREIRTNQRQQNFIDAVTHELHTPLASLRLYLDTLRKPDLDAEVRDEFVGIMSDDVERLERTIRRVLDAARSEAPRFHREIVDLGKLLGECVEEAREAHGLSGEHIGLTLPGPAQVRGDVEQLRLAFRNLIENAIRYAGSRLRVDVRVRRTSSRKLEVEVADQGVGISSASLRRLFQRFQRLGNETPRPVRGLGLGLYIVRNVVRAHGGSVRAESEGPGLGSRFIVKLPGHLDGNADTAGRG
jgi:signal transduction histidine kinase